MQARRRSRFRGSSAQLEDQRPILQPLGVDIAKLKTVTDEHRFTGGIVFPNVADNRASPDPFVTLAHEPDALRQHQVPHAAIPQPVRPTQGVDHGRVVIWVMFEVCQSCETVRIPATPKQPLAVAVWTSEMRLDLKFTLARMVFAATRYVSTLRRIGARPALECLTVYRPVNLPPVLNRHACVLESPQESSG